MGCGNLLQQKTNLFLNTMNSYEQQVVESILANNEFGITQVVQYTRLKSLFYKQEEYASIVQLIKESKPEEINELDIHAKGCREYLDIIKFTDQNNRTFIATVYDSDERWQDPQMMEIFLSV